jgi:hypothetical protein
LGSLAVPNTSMTMMSSSSSLPKLNSMGMARTELT